MTNTTLSAGAKLYLLIESWPDTPGTEDAPHQANTQAHPDAAQTQPHTTDERH